MVQTLSHALQAREPQLQIVEHCSRVAAVACRLADSIGLADDEIDSIRTAALLHEIGMIAVPPELVRKAGPLTLAELQRVRSQAAIGAEIVRDVHPPIVSKLVRHQYDDYLELLRQKGQDSRELLMAGILRAADVLDATSHPRPYQLALSQERQLEILQAGTGIRFHPAVMEVLMENSSASVA